MKKCSPGTRLSQHAFGEGGGGSHLSDEALQHIRALLLPRMKCTKTQGKTNGVARVAVAELEYFWWTESRSFTKLIGEL